MLFEVIIKFEFLHKTEQIRINLVEGTSETLSNRLYIKFPAKKDEKIYGGVTPAYRHIFNKFV